MPAAHLAGFKMMRFGVLAGQVLAAVDQIGHRRDGLEPYRRKRYRKRLRGVGAAAATVDLAEFGIGQLALLGVKLRLVGLHVPLLPSNGDGRGISVTAPTGCYLAHTIRRGPAIHRRRCYARQHGWPTRATRTEGQRAG